MQVIEIKPKSKSLNALKTRTYVFNKMVLSFKKVLKAFSLSINLNVIIQNI